MAITECFFSFQHPEGVYSLDLVAMVATGQLEDLQVARTQVLPDLATDKLLDRTPEERQITLSGRK